MKVKEQFGDIHKIFAARLKGLRTERGLSQQQVSESTGVPAPSIGFYERGSRVPDMRILWLLSRFFNVTSDYLLGLSDDPLRAKAWPPAVPSDASEYISTIKAAVEGMISDCLLTPYGAASIAEYSRIVSLLPKIDALALDHIHKMALKYPGFKSFGRLDEVKIGGVGFRDALLSGDQRAIEYVEDFNDEVAAMQNEAGEIAAEISSIINGRLMSAITCGAVLSIEDKEPTPDSSGMDFDRLHGGAHE